MSSFLLLSPRSMSSVAAAVSLAPLMMMSCDDVSWSNADVSLINDSCYC